MEISAALLVVGGVLAVTALAAIVVRRRSQRTRATTGTDASVVDPQSLGISGFDAPVTLVQFSTDYCSRCPGVARTLQDLTSGTETAFVEVDLTHRPDLARDFRVLQTPTVLIIDREGRLQARLSGALNRQTLSEHLAPFQGDLHVAA